VILARRLRRWDGRYDLLDGSRRVATWEGAHWSTGGRFTLDGRSFTVRADLQGDVVTLTEGGGRRVATAHGIGRRHWAIEAAGTTYQFSRGAPWHREERLYDEARRRLGSVRRTNLWRGDATADLPGLPPEIEVFAIAVALTRWQADAAPTG
jgi:hypothetical protein